ncbi:MAG: MotA/TolQ/ExbB proton channel family protein [Phycisphaerales bacterium]
MRRTQSTSRSPLMRRACATAGVLLAALPAMPAAAAGPSFATVFFISMDTLADGSTRVDWIGSAMIWVLIAMSVTSISLIGLLLSANKPADILPPGAVEQARSLVSEGRYAEAIELSRGAGDFGRVLHAALSAAPGGYDAMTTAAAQMSDELVVRRLRRVEILNTFGQVAPMIGLFGTVYGMIVAFLTIAQMGGTADPVALAGGIGTALVTTFWGLLIAIPALSAFAVVRNRIDAASTEAARETEQILARFRPSSGQTPVAALRGGAEGAEAAG